MTPALDKGNGPPSEPSRESILELVAALGDPNWQVRKVTVNALAKHGSHEALTAILQLLRRETQDLSILNSALQVLTLINLDVLSPLLELLADADPEMRLYAALVLGELNNPQATPGLRAALTDPHPNVRYHAIEALGKIRAADAVEDLCAIATGGDFSLAFPALDALRRIGHPRAAAAILPLLQDEMLREPAAEALGELGDQEAVIPLAQLLDQPHPPVLAVARALVGLYDRYEELYREGAHIADLARGAITGTGISHLVDAIKSVQPEDLQPLARVLGWLAGPEIEQALVRLLGNPAARQAVVDALVRQGEPMTDILISQLQAEDPEIRKAALIALGRIGGGRAVPALIQALEFDPDLVLVAAGALAKIGDRRAFEPLLDLLGHPQTAVRQAAIGALNSIGHPDMEGRMARMLTDPDRLVRISAITIAGYFGYPSCADLLLGCCHDDLEEVRAAAMEHIAYLEDDRVLPILGQVMRQETPRVKAAAARALSFLDHNLVWPHLQVGLKDSDPWVRYFSARSVGRQGLPEATPILTRLIQQDPAPQVRIAAIEALGRIGGLKAIATLAPLAEHDDLDLARAALTALGNIGHPQALGILLSVIRSPDSLRREEAVRALGERGGSAAEHALLRVADTDQDHQVRRLAIQTLAHLGTPAAIGGLLELCVQPDRREDCIAALVKLNPTRIPLLVPGLRYGRPEVRRAAVEVLARLKHPEATDQILAALKDQDREVRLAATLALKHYGSTQDQDPSDAPGPA
ncbi:MAG: HEAT repeat domain-containing protein [Desulfobacterales bacterium]|nr:HEAT repeat domain-containing protein [Pseudomonadota bacterium]MBU4356814.1 HEAT repeat domain-containing protein [Pseudomonadota bacterium]MCG2772316.1 HEAT repeat domain-containing protein [Desulfobacterales bacterium]